VAALLRSADAGVRGAAVLALRLGGAHVGDEALEAACGACVAGDGGPDARAAAVEAVAAHAARLGARGGALAQRARAAFEAALSAPDPGVALSAAAALVATAAAGSPPGADPADAALASRVPWAAGRTRHERRAAVAGLGWLGPAAACHAPVLEALLAHDQDQDQDQDQDADRPLLAPAASRALASLRGGGECARAAVQAAEETALAAVAAHAAAFPALAWPPAGSLAASLAPGLHAHLLDDPAFARRLVGLPAAADAQSAPRHP